MWSDADDFGFDWRAAAEKARFSPGIGIPTPGGEFYITAEALGLDFFILINKRGNYAFAMRTHSGRRYGVYMIEAFYRLSVIERARIMNYMTAASRQMLYNLNVDEELMNVGYPYWRRRPGSYLRNLILRKPGIYNRRLKKLIDD